MTQRSKTIESANQSITNVVPDYQVVAGRIWFGPKGVSEFVVLVTVTQTLMAANASALFSNASSSSADVFSALALPQTQSCLLGVSYDPLDFYNNETALELYLCCLLSPLNAPGIGAFMNNVETYFMGGSQSTWTNFQNDVNVAIENVSQLRAIVTNSIESKVCKDDKRIHTPQTQTLRATLTGQILGSVIKILKYVNARAVSLQGCITNPVVSTGCVTNTEPTTSLIPLPAYKFSDYDATFQATCSYASLAAFELFKASTTSC